MKNLNLKLAGTLALSLLTASTFAQINWQKGGNANVPFGAPSTIGTDASWNAPFSIMTNGIQRVFISETNALAASYGNVGIGSIFFQGGPFVPLSNLHIAQDNNTNPFGGGLRNWMQTSGTNGTNNNTNSAGTGLMISNGDNVWLGLTLNV